VPVLTNDEIAWTKSLFVQKIRYMPTKKPRSAQVFYEIVSGEDNSDEDAEDDD
jgi:hypothetical protein